MHLPIWLWVWIIIVALIKIFNIALVFIHTKKLISIHSVLNKTTGFALFLLPLLLTFVETTYSVATICVLATISVMQEVYFFAKGQEVSGFDFEYTDDDECSAVCRSGWNPDEWVRH